MDFGIQSERRWRRELEEELDWMQLLARRLVHGEEEASELVQETVLAALAKPPGDQGRPRAWLRTVMANLARQRGRRAWVRRRVSLDEPEPSDPGPAPGDSEEQNEVERLLLSELATLDEPFRSTLKQHFLGGLQLVQIARRDGVPEGTVRWRLKAGLERLRMRLDGRYGDRRRWLAALLPFAGPRSPAPLAPGLPVGLLAGGAALLALVAGVAWFSLRDEAAPVEVAARDLPLRAAPTEPAPASPGAALPALPTPTTSVDEAVSGASSFPLAVTVLDVAGVAVGGAAVSVFGERGFEPRGFTGPDGRVELVARAADIGALGVPLAHDRLVLRAAAEGHATSDALFLRAGESEAIELVLGGRERVLRGRVTDGKSGLPLGGVGIHALLDPSLTMPAEEDAFSGPLALATVSGVDGTYELRGLLPRPYAIVVTREHSEPSIVLVNAEREELPLVFVLGGSVRGRIVDELGEPAVAARVWAEPLHRGTDWCAGVPGYRSELQGFALETRTDEQGWYELYDVHPRARRVRAVAAAAPFPVASALFTVPSERVTDWSAFLAPEAGHRLRVIDEDGAALAGWVVQLVARRAEGGRFTRQLVTDPTGRVDCRDTDGEVEVLVLGPSGMGQPLLTRRLASSEEELTLVVPTERSAHLVGRLPLEVLATDPEARVIAYHLGSGQQFALELERESGRFRAELGQGQYAVLLHDRLGGALLSEVSLQRGERRRLGKFTLPETGTVLLRADRPETLSGNYRFELCFGRNSMKWQEGALPLFGAYTLHAGLYRLDTVGPGGLLESGWVEVVPGGAHTLDLTSLARLEINARRSAEAERTWLEVFPADGEPSAAGREAERLLLLQRRSDGVFRHALRLAEGDWIVQIVDEGGETREKRVHVPAAGEHLLEF